MGMMSGEGAVLFTAGRDGGRSYSPPVGMGGGPIRRRQGWWAVLFAAGRDGGRASSGEVVLDTLRLGLDLSLSLLGGLQRPLLAVA